MRPAKRENVQELLDSASDDDANGPRIPRWTPPPRERAQRGGYASKDRGVNRAERVAIVASESDSDTPHAQPGGGRWSVRQASTSPSTSPEESRQGGWAFTGGGGGSIHSVSSIHLVSPTVTQLRADKELILWLNSQSFPSALLCSDVGDLRSGQIVFDCKSLFLCKSDPASLTLAPAHAGPPAHRIAASIEALMAFFRADPDIAAQSMMKETLDYLSVLREALLRNAAAVAKGGWWVDEVLMWMVAVFRYIAHAGSFPDPARLVEAVQGARIASRTTIPLAQSYNTTLAANGPPKEASTEVATGASRQISPSQHASPLEGAPKATPPMRSLLKQDQRGNDTRNPASRSVCETKEQSAVRISKSKGFENLLGRSVADKPQGVLHPFLHRPCNTSARPQEERTRPVASSRCVLQCIAVWCSVVP